MTLQQGSNGPDVSILQQELVAVGLGLTVEGQYGNKTKATIRAFQRDQQLAETGIADEDTQTKLAEAIIYGYTVPIEIQAYAQSLLGGGSSNSTSSNQTPPQDDPEESSFPIEIVIGLGLIGISAYFLLVNKR
jgi:peptidoglycan hydrolase-like protein with peptidoglycan-binding domain